MYLALFKSNSGEIITHEAASLGRMKTVRSELNLAKEYNPLYFFQANEDENAFNFYVVEGLNEIEHYHNGDIIDTIPDDIKIAAMKWLYPGIRGTFMLCFYVNTKNIMLAGDAAIIGYLGAPKKRGDSGNLFYKKLSGTFESVLTEFYGNDISLPEIIKSHWPDVNSAEIALYSFFEGKTLPVDFGMFDNVIRINNTTLNQFGLKI